MREAYFMFIFKKNLAKKWIHCSKNEKKIIIDEGFGNGRLLSPPTDGERQKLKLIPPKSIVESNEEKSKDRS